MLHFYRKTYMSTQELATEAKKNTILVFEDADGTVRHAFCTQAEATERLKLATAAGSGGSMFINEDLGAEMVYAVSPDLRERVGEAKRKLRNDILVRDALNRQGVPNDRDLRIKIKKAIDELRESVLLRPL